MVFVFEVPDEKQFPAIRFVDAPRNVMCVEVSWIRVQGTTGYAYRSVFRIPDRVFWNAVVRRIMFFTQMPLEAIACFEIPMIFTEPAPVIMVVGCSCWKAL